MFGEPVVDASFFGREVDADGDDFAVVYSPGEVVFLAFDLVEGLLGRLVELQLHDVDVVRSADEDVDAPVRRSVFSLGHYTYEFKDDEQSVADILLFIYLEIIREP